jgi:hypothetical protein
MLEQVRILGSTIKSDPIRDYLSVAKLKKTKVVLSMLVNANSYLMVVRVLLQIDN